MALDYYEGLVLSTSRMYASWVHRDEEDLAQELRVRVWRALQTYDSSKSSQTVERYVFGAITNKIKDFKRDAKRAADRGHVLHIEDFLTAHYSQLSDSIMGGHATGAERFADKHHFMEEEEAYDVLYDADLSWPDGATDTERSVAELLVIGVSREEIADLMRIKRARIGLLLRSLRDRFDQQPLAA